MLKKIAIAALSTVVLGAVGMSAYNSVAGETAPSAAVIEESQIAPAFGAGQGYGNGPVSASGQGQGGKGYHGGRTDWTPGAGDGTPNPQANVSEWLTLQGTVSNFTLTSFVLEADEGLIPVQLGNSYFVENLGLTLQPGDRVTVTGFWESPEQFTARQVTLDATGQIFVLREESGRPLWAGGPKH